MRRMHDDDAIGFLQEINDDLAVLFIYIISIWIPTPITSLIGCQNEHKQKTKTSQIAPIDKRVFIKTYGLNIVAITSFPYAIRGLTCDIRYSISCRVNGMHLLKQGDYYLPATDY